VLLAALLADADLTWFERWERDVVHAFTCAWHGPVLETITKAVESKVLPVVLLFVALGWIARTDWRLAVRAWFAAAVGIGVGLLLAQVIWAVSPRPRPQAVFEAVLRAEAELGTCGARPEALALRSGGSTSPGFPSQHAVTVGVFATALLLARWRFGLAAVLYGLAVCAQRLHSGKHWPSDLVGGLVLGAAVSWACWRVYPPVARRLGLPRAPVPAPMAPPGKPEPRDPSEPGTGTPPG
jgi:membrane-associated phospholipid phosphatase